MENSIENIFFEDSSIPHFLTYGKRPIAKFNLWDYFGMLERQFNELPIAEKLSFFLLEGDKKEEFLRYHAPYRVHVFSEGITNENSYTKYFLTEKDMLEEVRFLRDCQPINKGRHILDRGYTLLIDNQPEI